MQLKLFILPARNLAAAEAEIERLPALAPGAGRQEGICVGICVGREEPMKRQLEQLRNWGAVLLVGLASPTLADAASSTGVSPIFTVDTRFGGIVVSGR